MNTEYEFDFSALEKLRQLFDDEFESRFQLFLNYTDNYLRELRQAILCGASEEVEKIAHKLVSTTGQYGMVSLSRMARALEYSDKKDTPEHLLAMHDAMTHCFQSYKRLLDH